MQPRSIRKPQVRQSHVKLSKALKTMKIAVISDVHGNLLALLAVCYPCVVVRSVVARVYPRATGKSARLLHSLQLPANNALGG